MKKEWTVKNGAIGTHHKNRAGEYVDFRPSSSPIRCLGCNGSWWSKRDAKKYGFGILPPKGQTIEPLRLEPIRKEENEIKNEDGTYTKHTTYYFEFQGIEASLTTMRPEMGWWDKEAQERCRLASEAEQQNYRREREETEVRKKNFLDSIGEEIFLDHSWSQSKITQLQDGGNLEDYFIAVEVEKIFIKAFPFERELPWKIKEDAVKKFEGIVKKIIDAEKIKKEEKKKAWLARQGKK